MPLGEKAARRSKHAELNGSTKSGCSSMSSLGCAVTVVLVVFCCLQLILLQSHSDSFDSTSHENTRLWHHLQVHEANLTALTLQQRELTRLLGQLNNLIISQQRELQNVEEQLAAPPAPTVVGTADTAVTRKMRAMSREHQEESERQQREIQSLQSALQRMSLQHPAPVPPVPPVPPPVPPSEKGESGGQAASPSGNQDFPSEWLAHFSRAELDASAKEAEKWREMARNAAIHAWKGYRERAWGKDEMRPVSGSQGRVWGNMGLQILDGLSTLWIMDLKDQFNEGAQWVEQSLQFDHPGFVSFFEITIRGLGGLLSAHALSGRKIFLSKAQELGEKLLKAINPQTGFPMTQFNVRTGEGKKGWFSGTLLAEAGTVQLEFRYLSEQLGDQRFAEAGDRAMRQILQAENGQGLVPWGLSNAGAPRFTNSHITFGAMGDSYYEYLLKLYVQSDKTEPEWKEAWKRAISKAFQRLIFTTKGGLTYIAEEKNGRTDHKMDHLACFVGGMLIYAARELKPEEVDARWEQTAAGITETCYEMYRRQPTHLAPEATRFNPQGGQGQDMSAWNNAGQYLLRPEAAEAIFYMFYYTGDPKYRRWAGEMMEAIERNCRAAYGYSAVSDVRRTPAAQRNEMETFFLAETLKYLYLTFLPNPRSVLNFDDYVLTTEAHPLLRTKKTEQSSRFQRFLGK